MRTLTLNLKQQRHVEIITRLEAGRLDPSTAATLLGRSPRQVRRLRARFRQASLGAVVHGNQGRTPVNRTDPALVDRILALAGPDGQYHDCNTCHLQDLLAGAGILIGRSTLDRLLKQAGLRQAARPPASARRRRTRRAAEGMLLQTDGSAHDWLEGRGPRMTLVGAIDDATGTVVYSHFRPTEDQVGYLLLLRTVAETHGLPMALYHDRHTILRSPKTPTLEDELAGRTPMSQVQRILAELGIESVAAHSPQAKGRIERLWKTFQDRLVKELRFAGISTIDAANAFLPGFIERYNARFAKAAADPEPAWVPLPPDLDRAYYFATREPRKVRADHCISWQGQLLQLQPNRDGPRLVEQTVTVHVVPEGDILVYHGKRPVAYERVATPPVRVRAAPAKPAKPVNPNARARQCAWLFGQP